MVVTAIIKEVVFKTEHQEPLSSAEQEKRETMIEKETLKQLIKKIVLASFVTMVFLITGSVLFLETYLLSYK